MEMSQLGNSIHHIIKKIDDQPKEGFAELVTAEAHLEERFAEGKYPFRDHDWDTFTILPVYVKQK